MGEMSYDILPRQVRIRTLSEQLYAAAQVNTWSFTNAGDLIYANCLQEADHLKVLKDSGCLDYACLQEGGCRFPTILSTACGVLWIAEHFYDRETAAFLILAGPFLLSHTSLSAVEQELSKMDLDLEDQKLLQLLIGDLPVLSVSVMNLIGRMLHFAITERPISSSDFVFQRTAGGLPSEREPAKQDSSLLYEDTPLPGEPDRLLIEEKLILKAISEGNPEFQEIMNRAKNGNNSLLTSTGSNLRDGKNTLLIFCHQCSRASIEGGLPAASAMALQRSFMQKIEQCRTMSSLMQLNQEMVSAFVRAVHDHNTTPKISPEIIKSCKYIRSHILDDLSLEEISSSAGYSEYYFSRKFRREMGMKVSDYIRDKKLEYAKMLLTSTGKSVQEISDTLRFSSRNYFSRIFKEKVGLSPVEYREVRPDRR